MALSRSSLSGLVGSSGGGTWGVATSLGVATRVATGSLGLVVLARTVEAGGRSAVLANGRRAGAHNACVHGARDAVLESEVHLGHLVVLVDGSLSHVTASSRFHDVTHNEAADGLVL